MNIYKGRLKITHSNGRTYDVEYYFNGRKYITETREGQIISEDLGNLIAMFLKEQARIPIMEQPERRRQVYRAIDKLEKNMGLDLKEFKQTISQETTPESLMGEQR